MKLLTQWAVTSSALILIVLAVRYLFRKKLSARLKYALWGVVLLRLLVPFQIELPADTSANLPLLASNFASELPTALERPLSPDTAAASTRIPAGRVEANNPNGDPAFSFTAADLRVFDLETGDLYVYRGGFTLGDMAVVLWITGAGLAALVILLSNLRFALWLRKRRDRIPAGGHRPPLQDAPIPVYVAEGLPSPCLFGVFKPAVYVTPEAAENPDTLRHVLAHELTHYAHKDHLWSLLRCLALAFHWYNPLVWLAVVLSKQDGELACDEGAVARLGEAERIPYGRTLVDMVAARSLRPGDLLSCSTAMTGGEKSIKRRVKQIVKKPETVKIALFAAVALVALAVVFVFATRGEDRPKLYGPYRYQVGRTQAVRYAPSPLSSQSYPDAITDPDLLETALDILDRAADLMNDPEELDLDLSDAPFVSPRVTLLEDPDSTDGHTYLLYTQHIGNFDDQCFLVTPAEIGADSYAVAAVLDASAPGALELLARRQRSRLEESLTSGNAEPERVHPVTGDGEQSSLLGDLTQEQVDQANEAFKEFEEIEPGMMASSEISCFFTSNYDDPTQIDLEEFLRYCPIGTGDGDCLGEEDTEEFLAVMAQDNSWTDPEWELHSPYDLPVPVHRYPRAEVSALLQKYAGVTVEQLDWSNCLYLEKYDAFYNFTSDAGPGFFPCAGGQIMEDSVLLWSRPNEDGDRCELTLRKNGDSWLIQSHHTIYER